RRSRRDRSQHRRQGLRRPARLPGGHRRRPGRGARQRAEQAGAGVLRRVQLPRRLPLRPRREGRSAVTTAQVGRPRAVAEAVDAPGSRVGSPPARSPRTAVATRATWSAAAWRVTGVVLVIALWEWLAARVANPAILPAPGLVVRNAIENFGGSPALAYLGLSETSYLGNLQYTAGVVLTAWAAGSMAGLVSGLLAARVQWVRDLTEPVNYVFGVVPVLVAAPFFLIWFGFGSTGQWVLVAFFSYVTVAGAGM